MDRSYSPERSDQPDVNPHEFVDRLKLDKFCEVAAGLQKRIAMLSWKAHWR